MRDAALAAGDIARRHFGNGPKTWDKGDGQGPVTEADLEIDTMLRDSLRAARPAYGWLSEETADGPERLDTDTVFIIDPIDGTRAFIEGSRSFSHSLAIVRCGVPIAAAVHLPMLDRMYLAHQGGGATLNGAAIGPTGRAALAGATVLGAKSNFDNDRWTGGTPPVEQCFRSSLAYRLALVAGGRFDAMITLRMAWEWDIAAGALLVAEAGGRIASQRGATLRFNNSHPQLDGVVAGSPAIAEALLDRLI
ncbi:3'(2'),5'-bisphosphate nucleotidase CysQ [Jannaschia donghaensis]|uniref:3'(2'),5'-bisphosphate nucleotidase CysQ n=1 Tax=Jannaschia donghaensis TaxID=420998 RepID=UPI001FDFA61B|nr:3'(2'),5'-bisphosphate nucleotidase CysQ [Jannaschia donghaensis]